MLSRKKKRKREKIRKVSRQMTCFVVDDIDNLQAIWNFKGTFTIIPENKSPFWVSFSVLRFFFSVFRVFEIVCFISFQETGMKKIEKKKNWKLFFEVFGTGWFGGFPGNCFWKRDAKRDYIWIFTFSGFENKKKFLETIPNATQVFCFWTSFMFFVLAALPSRYEYVFYNAVSWIMLWVIFLISTL